MGKLKAGLLGLGLATASLLPLAATSAGASPSVVTAFTGLDSTASTAGGVPGDWQWSFSTVTLGPSPLLARLGIGYVYAPSLACVHQSSFTILGLGGTVSGFAEDCSGANTSGTGDVLTGEVTAASGSYAGMVGQGVTEDLLVTPDGLGCIAGLIVLPACPPAGGLLAGVLHIS